MNEVDRSLRHFLRIHFIHTASLPSSLHSEELYEVTTGNRSDNKFMK